MANSGTSKEKHKPTSKGKLICGDVGVYSKMQVRPTNRQQRDHVPATNSMLQAAAAKPGYYDGLSAKRKKCIKNGMDMETWRKLLGKSQDDPAFKAELAAAGVRKIPKLDKGDFEVIFDLKGHGLWLEMTDEAYLKKLDDQDIGEGPLILTVVGAY